MINNGDLSNIPFGVIKHGRPLANPRASFSSLGKPSDGVLPQEIGGTTGPTLFFWLMVLNIRIQFLFGVPCTCWSTAHKKCNALGPRAEF